MRAGADKPRKRAARGTLDRSLIVRTAMQVLTDHGLAAVTIRRVAGELDVRPMALYTHFRSKDELLWSIYDELLARVHLPRPGEDDLAALRRMAHEYVRLLAEHPALLQADPAAYHTGINEIRFAEAFLQILLRHGIDRDEALRTLMTLSRFLIGAATTYPARDTQRDPAQRAQALTRLPPLSPAEFPIMRETTDRIAGMPTEDDALEFGLDLILHRLIDKTDGRS